MESVGEFFKQVRETKGLTLDEIASKTRIRSDFLQALEEGNFAKLPDQVFAKGFVRTYARSLGLDEEDTMLRFIQSAGAFYEKQEERERLRVKHAEDERRRRSSRKTFALAVGVALLLLVLLLTREQSSIFLTGPTPPPPSVTFEAASSEPQVSSGTVLHEPEQPSEAEQPLGGSQGDAASPVKALPSPQPNEDPSSAIQVPRELSTIPVSIPDDPLGGHGGNSPLVLDLEALELTWVVVQVDGGSPHEALLRAGERISWTGEEQFTLTLGNAGGVRVEMNGEPRGPFGPSGTVARGIVLKRQG